MSTTAELQTLQAAQKSLAISQQKVKSAILEASKRKGKLKAQRPQRTQKAKSSKRSKRSKK